MAENNDQHVFESTEESLCDDIRQCFSIIHYIDALSDQKKAFEDKINDVIAQLTELRDKYKN